MSIFGFRVARPTQAEGNKCLTIVGFPRRKFSRKRVFITTAKMKYLENFLNKFHDNIRKQVKQIYLIIANCKEFIHI